MIPEIRLELCNFVSYRGVHNSDGNESKLYHLSYKNFAEIFSGHFSFLSNYSSKCLLLWLIHSPLSVLEAKWKNMVHQDILKLFSGCTFRPASHHFRHIKGGLYFSQEETAGFWITDVMFTTHNFETVLQLLEINKKSNFLPAEAIIRKTPND